MKKLGLFVIAFLMMATVSCKKEDETTTPTNIDKSQIYGKWRTADSTYFEVYLRDGKGKFWDLNEDVQEEEASRFTWEFDTINETKFFQYHIGEMGEIIPQYCNILELTSSVFKYNNEGFRKTYNLIRAEQ